MGSGFSEGSTVGVGEAAGAGGVSGGSTGAGVFSLEAEETRKR